MANGLAPGPLRGPLIESHGYTVEAVFWEVGYRIASAITAAFKRWFGRPPKKRASKTFHCRANRKRWLRASRAVKKLSPLFHMRLEQIDHIALRCASPESTKEWYVSTLGFEHVFPGLWSGSPIVLRLGPTFITLFPEKEDGQPAASGRAWHLAMRAATYEDFQAAQAELQAKEISFQFRDHEIAHSIYFHDPDGFLLEITTYDLEEGR